MHKLHLMLAQLHHDRSIMNEIDNNFPHNSQIPRGRWCSKEVKLIAKLIIAQALRHRDKNIVHVRHRNDQIIVVIELSTVSKGSFHLIEAPMICQRIIGVKPRVRLREEHLRMPTTEAF